MNVEKYQKYQRYISSDPRWKEKRKQRLELAIGDLVTDGSALKKFCSTVWCDVVG